MPRGILSQTNTMIHTPMLRCTALLAAFFFCFNLFAQTPQDLAISLQTATGLTPPAVLLSWPTPDVSDITLRRRLKGQAGNQWTVLVQAPGTFLNGYYDTGVEAAKTYEYALERKTGNITAYGYAYAAMTPPVVDTRGKILVFIDSTTADQLGADLVNFKNDLRGEGWQTIPNKTGNYTTPQWVKNQIINAYNADPGNIKAILLMGNVPVPYSGSNAWDNRPDHVGAWPCDAYYGDIDGVWTDNTVNIPNTSRPANRNVPGDGKFDQNILPSTVEIPVGRLDFHRLSPATFGMPPVELLRRYLYKNHLFRTGQFAVPNRALIDDNLGWSAGEAFAADGYRNAYPLTGTGTVVNGDFLNNTNPDRYLMGFGAGIAGTYTSAGGVGNAATFANDTINVVFANFFGTYFGDWDYDIDPLMPAALASKGSILTCGWAGRPHWMLQALAAGETIGYGLLETQNAQYNDAYGHTNGESGIHISLLGDPTLRAKVVKPVSNLSALSNCNKVNLKWSASPDPAVLGYLVYRAFDLNGPYTRLTSDLVYNLDWIDLNPVADTLFYAVRAIKLETTPGGGVFFNSSTSPIANVIFTPGAPPTVIGLGGKLTCVNQSVILGSNSQPPGCGILWLNPDGSTHVGPTTNSGGVYTVIATAPNGCTTAAYATVEVDTFLPAINLPATITITCSNPATGFTVPDAPNGVHYFWNGTEVTPGSTIPLLGSGVFTVLSMINGCSKNYPVQVLVDVDPPGASASSDGNNLDCAHSFVQLYGNSVNGNGQYAWSGGGNFFPVQNPVVVDPGVYCLTITATNGCTSSSCVTVLASGEAVTTEINSSVGNCNNGDPINLDASISGGQAPYQYAWSTGDNTPTVHLPAGFTGTVSLTVTDSKQCVGSASWNIGAAIVVYVFRTNPSTAIAADGNIDLLPTGGVQPYSFQWSNGSTMEDLFNLPNGEYTVTLTDAVGCTYVQPVSLLTVGTEEADNLSGIRIAPNPSNEVVGIYLPHLEQVTIQLTDFSGRALERVSGTDTVFYLNTGHLPGGVYWVSVGSVNAWRMFRVFVAR